MRSLLASLTLAAVLVACAEPSGVLFQATLSNPNGEFPLPVTLGDETGLVVGIGAAQVDGGAFRDAGVLADPTGPNAFILTWLGGMCDSDAAVNFRSTDAGHDLHLAIHEKGGFGGCPAAGILRALRIQTSDPIQLDAVTVSGNRTIQLVLDEDCGPLRDAGTGDSKVACLALINATIGDRTDEFATVTVSPADGACPGTECSTAQGISAQPWQVQAEDRKGIGHTWRCVYRDEAAVCTEIPPPAST